MSKLRVRCRLAQALDPTSREDGLSRLNRALAVLILASVALAVLETEPVVLSGRETLFRGAEIVFGAVFALEYLARFWAAAERGGWRARWRWAVSPWALIDLIAILPVLIAVGAAPFYLLRLVRLLRLLRLAKLGRTSAALSLLSGAVRERRFELLVSLYAALLVMLVSAALMHLIEGAVQPEAFGSIPRALWWAVVTLTTIGYGDVYPLTIAGKFVAGATAVLGIGLIAAPTGILAAAFSDALARRRRVDRER